MSNRRMKPDIRVRETCRRHNLIESGDHIVLGLSGGPDSLCLYDVLLGMAEEMNLKIHPVHVNHKFRPGAAERDQAFVEKLCREKAAEHPDFADRCRSFVVDCNALAEEAGMTGEEAGRAARYDAFFRVAQEISGGFSEGVKIAVAQNANDQAETILFRILRGTGTDGLAGIAYERDDTRQRTETDGRAEEDNCEEQRYKVIRPLLDTWRSDIEAYCIERELTPVRDHTNQEEIYSRNRIRLDLIPYIRDRYNENIEAGLNRLGTIAAEDKDYFWQETCRTLEQLRVTGAGGGSDVTLDREGLAAAHGAIRHRVVMKAFGEIGLTSDITAERLEAADRIIMKKQGEKTVEFPHGYRLRVAKGKVHFESGCENT